MARIRSIHPGLFTSEEYMLLSIEAKVAYPGLWTEADDHGVFEWKPVTLKARLLPADNVDMSALLNEMQEKGVVKRFTDNGREYGIIKGFCKWQRPKRPTYRLPFPEEFRTFAAWTPTKAEPQDDDGQPLPDTYPTTPPIYAQREEEGGRRDSVPPELPDGGEPDLRKATFDAGVKLLGKASVAEPQARSLIGKWRKDYGDGAVLEALGRYQHAGATEPVSFITAVLKAGKSTGPPAVKQGWN